MKRVGRFGDAYQRVLIEGVPLVDPELESRYLIKLMEGYRTIKGQTTEHKPPEPKKTSHTQQQPQRSNGSMQQQQKGHDKNPFHNSSSQRLGGNYRQGR